MENHCNFWLPKKKRFCANIPLKEYHFCGNHKPGSEELRVPCPIDPSHSIAQENLDVHVKKCPFQKQVQALQAQPFYKKGVNGGRDEDEKAGNNPLEAKIGMKTTCESSNMSSQAKREAIYKMGVPEFYELIEKIKSIHDSISSNILDSYALPEACSRWLKQQVDRNLPFQEKHVLQQASILGNMEAFGVLEKRVDLNESESEHLCSEKSPREFRCPAVIEFGAGRGYLTHMLTDCYGIKKVCLVERKSYKLKADRSMRPEKGISIERLRIDIEDLNLNGIESLMGDPYLAVGKHLCGPATDLTLRCCLSDQYCQNKVACSGITCNLNGLALATCCHHLCQWNHYINKKFMLSLGITKELFHAITWFTSWAVDADHGSNLPDLSNLGLHLDTFEKKDSEAVGGGGGGGGGVEEVVRSMKAVDRAILGFMCKEVIDVGRLMWIKDCGLDAQLVKYVPYNISPENHLLLAKYNNHMPV